MGHITATGEGGDKNGTDHTPLLDASWLGILSVRGCIVRASPGNPLWVGPVSGSGGLPRIAPGGRCAVSRCPYGCSSCRLAGGSGWKQGGVGQAVGPFRLSLAPADGRRSLLPLVQRAVCRLRALVSDGDASSQAGKGCIALAAPATEAESGSDQKWNSHFFFQSVGGFDVANVGKISDTPNAWRTFLRCQKGTAVGNRRVGCDDMKAMSCFLLID